MVILHTTKTACKSFRTHTSEDLRLLRLLHSRRHRLEGEMVRGWDTALSLELDLVHALEERVLTGWGRRLEMR
jgi:hypothetical protein